MPHGRRKLTVVLSMVLGIAAPVGVLIAASAARDLQKARHDHYHELGEAFKTVRDQSREGTPDMTKIKAAAQVIHEASIDQGRWFPAGTGPEAGKTRALPEIWKRPADFTAAQKVFSDAAPKLLAAANSGDAKAVKTTYGELGKACKNCHDTFRAPEDHN
ncbi:MAG TPA: cytochrome c [Steroidobacteraceae bacterium]|nr:cytochrome c [Steroidobacteraceae bacterium]